MNKIIVSSARLNIHLNHFITPLIFQKDDFEVIIRCKEKTLIFGESDIKINAESHNDFSVELRIGYLRTLQKILSLLDDQPLTITFGDFIEISRILI